MPWMSRHRRLIVAAICASITGLIILVHFFPGVPFLSAVWRQEQNYQDFLEREGRKTATRSDLVFLGIDEASLDLSNLLLPEELEGNRAFQLMTKRPPWSTEVWALLLDRVFEAGARVVIFDLVFNFSNPEGDPAFRAALDRYRGRVVLAANIDAAQGMKVVVPHPDLIPPPQVMDDRVGYANFFPDNLDQKVRSIFFNTSDRRLAGQELHPSQEVYYAMSSRALMKLGHGADIPLDFEPHQFRFSDESAYSPRSVYEIFDARLWQANYAGGAFFKDKIVMVGASAQVAHDFVATPLSPGTPGPALHLQVIAATLAREFLHNTSRQTNFILVILAGALAWVIALLRRPLLSLIALIAVAAIYLIIARLAYDRSGLLLLVVPVLTGFLLSGLLSLGFEYVLERMEKLRTRRTLERYVSKNLVKEILDNPDSFYSSLRGVRLPATVLFSDIVGFTSMTESADPEQLVAQLNEYLSRMTAAVFKNNGTLDKFIGDAVMAVWGNVSSRGVAEDARSCARTALAMRRELEALNKKWEAEGIAPFHIGIGINQGDVLGGNIGSQEKADPTVIGDAVNLASRLEALTRTYGVDILVGARARELISDEFDLRSVALVQVKGKTKPVEIFTLIGAKKEPGDPEFLQRLETYEMGFRKFREREFTQAKILFSQFLEFYPDDSLAKMYLERALEYEEQPPDEAWNAVEVFKKK